MCDVTTNLLKRKRSLSSSSSSSEEEYCRGDTTSGDDPRLRQRVVELSVAKVRMAAPLTRSLRRREPPLLRSVLILNTLRAVDAGVPVHPALTTALPATPFRPESDVVDAVPGQPRADHAHQPGEGDDAAASSMLDDLFGVERTSSPLPPVLTFSSLYDLDCSSVWPATPSPMLASPSFQPMDVDFDVDVALFDLEPVVTLGPGWAASSRSETAVLPCQSDVVVAGSTTSCTQRNQFFVEELERIAQILVGT